MKVQQAFPGAPLSHAHYFTTTESYCLYLLAYLLLLIVLRHTLSFTWVLVELMGVVQVCLARHEADAIRLDSRRAYALYEAFRPEVASACVPGWLCVCLCVSACLSEFGCLCAFVSMCLCLCVSARVYVFECVRASVSGWCA